MEQNELKIYKTEQINCDAISPSPANPRKSKDSDIDSLRESIKAQGLLHPIVVRRKSPGSGRYEVVSGERRWRAVMQLSDTIPAVVRDLTDQEANEITVVENMQREDLTPMEEASGIRTLLDQGKDSQEIADRLGKPVGWVLRRAKLQNLSAKWRKALQDMDEWPSKLSASHLELIARFEQTVQDDILEHNDFENESVEEVRDYLEEYYMLNLASAPWKLADSTLGDACAQCQKRTSPQQDLFDDMVHRKGKHSIDRCLDRKCWNEKCRKAIERKAAEIRMDNPKLLLLDHGGDMFDDESALKKEAVPYYSVTQAKKTDKKAVQALVIERAGAGQVTWVIPRHSDGSTSRATIKAGGKKSMAEKKAALEKRRTIRFDGLVVDELEKLFKEPSACKVKFTFEFVTNLVCRFGAEELRKSIDSSMCAWNRSDNPFGKVKLEGNDTASLLRCVLPLIRGRILDDIRYDADRKKALTVCDWFGFDAKAMIVRVEKEIPEPKSWELERLEAKVKSRKKKPGHLKPRKVAERKCRVCGCTDNDCMQCIEKTGEPCRWVEDDLCSACAEEGKKTATKRKLGRSLDEMLGSKKK